MNLAHRWKRLWIAGLMLAMAVMVSMLGGCGAMNELLDQPPAASEQGIEAPHTAEQDHSDDPLPNDSPGQDGAADSTGIGLDEQFEKMARSDSSLEEFREVALYLIKHQELPEHYMTKAEARKLGWVAQQGNLHKIAPGAAIGGDVFQNREGRLPKAKGRTWYEADIHYDGGKRGAERLLYSNDMLIYMTQDHYQSFTLIYNGKG